MARLLRVKAYARGVFEDAATAEAWLSEPNPALGRRAPMELLTTDEGTRAVETGTPPDRLRRLQLSLEATAAPGIRVNAAWHSLAAFLILGWANSPIIGQLLSTRDQA